MVEENISQGFKLKNIDETRNFYIELTIVKSNSTNKYKQNQIKVQQKTKLKYNYRHNLQMQVAGFHSLMCFLKSSILSRILKFFETTFNIRL